MNKESRTFFISGHRDITEEEFNRLYVPKIIESNNKYDAKYIIGDYIGVDIMAQNYLVDILNINQNSIIVCHMFDKPMNVNNKITNLIGGFKTDEERDSYMTQHSDEDIAFIRKGKINSGTEQNVLRRIRF
ncbi:MAG: hypothetical protein IKT40_12530 [Bacilli bacterium]|nr:hypothetical protein [Bacilli bacterium]